MFMFLFFLIVVFFILLIFMLIILSTLEIKIDKFYLDTTKIKGKKIQFNLINVYLKLFNKIKWLKIKIDNKKIQKLKLDEKQYINIKILKNINMLDIKLSKFKMYLKIGTEDSILTSFITSIIASITGIFISNGIDKFDDEKYKYIITPYYTNTNFLKVNLNCIINVKMVHIINVIYTLIQKRSEVKYARTSNRRTYDYSNE